MKSQQMPKCITCDKEVRTPGQSCSKNDGRSCVPEYIHARTGEDSFGLMERLRRQREDSELDHRKIAGELTLS